MLWKRGLNELYLFGIFDGKRSLGYENKKNPQAIRKEKLADFKVSEMRLELTRSNDHYPLKVARLPIPPSGH